MMWYSIAIGGIALLMWEALRRLKADDANDSGVTFAVMASCFLFITLLFLFLDLKYIFD